jgi:hypothetical protein
MEARRLVDTAAFGPDTLEVLGRAFDEAWATIEGQFGCDQSREAARVRLAVALLSIADADSRDVEALKRTALEAMARDYRWQGMQSPTKQ